MQSHRIQIAVIKDNSSLYLPIAVILLIECSSTEYRVGNNVAGMLAMTRDDRPVAPQNRDQNFTNDFGEAAETPVHHINYRHKP
jgi:hypothetical protein